MKVAVIGASDKPERYSYKAKAQGIATIDNCTLVMLRTGQF
jgi:hypothetical protein